MPVARWEASSPGAWRFVSFHISSVVVFNADTNVVGHRDTLTEQCLLDQGSAPIRLHGSLT